MRLQVHINDELLKKIDFYCEKFSVNRSALCAMLIGHSLLAMDNSLMNITEESKGYASQLTSKIKKEQKSEG